MDTRRTISPKQWSVMKYDLKTGLDIHNLPCSVRIVDGCLDNYISNGNHLTTEHTPGCEIRFEKVICVCFVRARVIDLPDVEWFVKKRGQEFVRSQAIFSGAEILIPLEYAGGVRLYDRYGGKQYFTVREVVEDFPRYVRVEKDTICASPNISTPQIVYKGTILELDRVTKTIQTVRGSRETYLICKDKENQRELAFRYMVAIHFSSVSDMTKCCLKDFIEKLPLPQTVEFLNVNPYDVISIDDDDAQDLLILLNGPLELLNLHMENFVVGRTEACETCEDEICDIMAIPAKDEVLENIFVHLPLGSESGCHSNMCDRTVGDYVALTVIKGDLYDSLHQKLYLRFVGDDTPLVLRTQHPGLRTYEIECLPDTPPLPEKTQQMTHATSAPDVQAQSDDKGNVNKLDRRKRIVSANDVDKDCEYNRTSEERRGLKSYITQLTRRVKTAALLFSSETFSGDVDQDVFEKQPSSRKNLPSINKRYSENGNGFVCYLDKPFRKNDKDIKSNSSSETTDSGLPAHDGVIYASIETIHRRKSIGMHPCSLCREIVLNDQKNYSSNK